MTLWAQMERQPDIYELKNGTIYAMLVREHKRYPERYVIHCYTLGMICVETDIPSAVAPQVAGKRAMQLLIDRLKRLNNDLGQCTDTVVDFQPKISKGGLPSAL